VLWAPGEEWTALAAEKSHWLQTVTRSSHQLRLSWPLRTSERERQFVEERHW
jgi:hypothetical protein